MKLPLSQMKIGQKGRVTDISGESELYQRLLEMGLTTGTPVEVVRFAPMGDPIDIKIRGYHLSLRHQEARFVQIEVEN